ncbi:MAG: alpha/beta fold hydrolase, partial [Burkholderiaceae bacterium]
EFMAGADLPSLLTRSHALTLPTSFLLGAQDAWVKELPLKNVIRSSFPTADVTTWPGGHLLHEERPAEVARFIQTIVLTA